MIYLFIDLPVGLYASVTNVEGEQPGYISSCGIHEIAFESVDNRKVINSFIRILLKFLCQVITPYGAFPVIVANQSVGLVWYLTMLQGPKMQGERN